MLSKVRVIPEADFFRVVLRRVRRCARVVQTGVTGEPDPATRGTNLKLKGCCGSCPPPRQQVGGPDLEGTLRQPGPLCYAEGKGVTLTADEDYLARSIITLPRKW